MGDGITDIAGIAAGGPLHPSAWTAAFAVLAVGILLGPVALYWSRMKQVVLRADELRDVSVRERG